MINPLLMAVLLLLAVASVPLSLAGQAQKFPVRTEMLVSTQWLAAHLHDEDMVVLCIASNQSFYAQGHIPGARWINFADIVTNRGDIPNELPSVTSLQQVFERAGVTNQSRITLYGERLGLLAARTYFTLDYLGLADHAALLDGGLEKWRLEGRPQASEIPPIKRGHVIVHPRKTVLVELGEIRELSSDVTHVTLIDARPREEYSGQRLSEDVRRAGHIPGSANLYWMENIVSRENPVLRSLADLRRIYENAGVKRNSRAVTYCRTGMQSSFDYFVAKYLGYDVGMYDGSFFEWSRENLPVETGSTKGKPRKVREEAK